MERIYYEDVYRKDFKAQVTTCLELPSGQYGIILDKTVFYPEGGGQPADTGSLGAARVLDVHERQGEIVHETDEPLLPGTTVEGCINWEWRYENMQHHSGEHLLSGLIHKNFGYDNVGFHMGKDEVTIDFNGTLTQEQLSVVEQEANRKIYENIPIEVWYPKKEELEALEYRSKKALTGDIRIVRIAGGDTCACCGTHVKTTGEIGIIKVTGMIHYKSGVRMSMLCGLKAWQDYDKKQIRILRLSNLLSAKPELVVEATKKLMEASSEKDTTIAYLQQQLFEWKLKSYEESNQPLLVIEEGLTPFLLRTYCTMLYEQKKGSIVLVCSGTDGLYQYAAGSCERDMRILGKEWNSFLHGKGGGSSLMVQGTFAATAKEIATVWEKTT